LSEQFFIPNEVIYPFVGVLCTIIFFIFVEYCCDQRRKSSSANAVIDLQSKEQQEKPYETHRHFKYCCKTRKFVDVGKETISWNNFVLYFTNENFILSLIAFCLWLVHLTDTLSDLLYFTTTPFYSTGLLVLSVIFWLLPILIALLIACLETEGGTCNIFCRFYLDLSVTTKPPSDENHMAEKAGFKLLFFVMLEDAPQVLIQVINTLYIGQTLTYVQLIAPLIGLFSVLKGLRDYMKHTFKKSSKESGVG